MRTDTCMNSLLWGCWTAILMEVPGMKVWLTKHFSVGIWLAIVGLLVIDARYPSLFGGLLLPVICPWLILGTVLRAHSWPGAFLESAPLRWIGRLSYSLYLWQQLFLLGSWSEIRPFPLGLLQEFPLNIIAAVSCATFSYYVIEQPMIRLGRRWEHGLKRNSGDALSESTCLASATIK